MSGGDGVEVGGYNHGEEAVLEGLAPGPLLPLVEVHVQNLFLKEERDKEQAGKNPHREPAQHPGMVALHKNPPSAYACRVTTGLPSGSSRGVKPAAFPFL